MPFYIPLRYSNLGTFPMCIHHAFLVEDRFTASSSMMIARIDYAR